MIHTIHGWYTEENTIFFAIFIPAEMTYLLGDGQTFPRQHSSIIWVGMGPIQE